ncbi:copper resistance protein CopD [Halovivax cerinus]|uniref:Copper resistance protein CopD n=1 Tax=Halovivax cerinus TaxID=1487865 RepID=A0ABD5NSV3_9EURY|nr:copper resistance protein CopD [Halovivax cerinus]
MIDLVLARTTHLLVAAIWAGSVCFVALSVVPAARDGVFTTTDPLTTLLGTLKRVSRASSVLLLLTGGHMAGRIYTSETLVSTVNGQLVLLMTALWLVLTILVEVAAKRFETGLDAKQLRGPARETLGLFRAAAVVSLALLVVAGAISSNAATLL